MFASRGLRRVLRAPFSKWHYVALANAFRVYERPVEALSRYVLGRGAYPWTCALRTPLGRVEVTLHTPDDMQTVTEIFCREDYAAPPDVRVVVDVGSNIGVSALYFLTRNRECRCYLYEPDPRNLPKLRANLVPFAGRYVLHEVAVADTEGDVDFGIEPTGRYGGIGVPTGETIRVRARDVNAVLAEVLEREDEIDVLKLDTEGLERSTVAAIRPELLERIRLVTFEAAPRDQPLHVGIFDRTRRGSCERLVRRGSVPSAVQTR